MVAATFAPSALAFYRCEMMGTSMSTPCCDDDADHSVAPAPQLFGERCCSRVVVSLERAPSKVNAPPVDLAAPALGVGVELPVAVALNAGFPRPFARSQFDSGPPILRRTCSLQI